MQLVAALHGTNIGQDAIAIEHNGGVGVALLSTLRKGEARLHAPMTFRSA